MNNKCKTSRHRCYANKKCYRKSLWTRKNLIKRCKVGTRKCRDNKCHKKKTNSIRLKSVKAISAKSKSAKSIEPIRAITNNMVNKIASKISNTFSTKASVKSKKKRPAWR
jgi:hypothetical protein